MTQAVTFYIISGLMLASALCVVFSRQPVYSVLSLLSAMFCMAAMFITLEAYFVAALQILLYAGAVLVLFLFVFMLLNLSPDALSRRRALLLQSLGAGVGLLFFVQLVRMIGEADETGWLPSIRDTMTSTTVRDVGMQLLTKYLLPFELISFLILAAIVGAITLAQSRKSK